MTLERSTSTSRPAPELEAALRELGSALAVPAPGGAFASRVTARIEAERPRRLPVTWWAGLPGMTRPLRRSVLLAAAALLVVTAVAAAAIGWGLPGLRIIFGPVPTATDPASPPSVPPGGPGATLGLGTRLTLERAQELVGFEILLPDDPALGPPEAVYLAGSRLALAWGEGPGRPGTAVPGVGLLLMEIRATVDDGMLQKIVDSGTPVEALEVEGAPGYWISGDSHELIFIEPDGDAVADARRLAGNTLVWTRDGTTYRLEGDLDRETALALAASLR